MNSRSRALVTAVSAGLLIGSAVVRGEPAEDPTPPTVTGTVVTPDGQPVPGADVFAFQGIYLKQQLKSDAQGRFEVPRDWRDKNPFRSMVARVGTDRIGWFSFSMHKFSAEGQKTPDGSFRIVLLPVNRKVRGSITDADKNPLAGVPVHVEFMSHETNLLDSHWPRRKVDNVPLLPGTVTADDGSFVLAVPSNTSVTLRAVHPDWAARRITVKSDQTSVAPVRMQPAAKLKGRVIDSRTSAPVSGVRVGAQMSSRINDDIMRHGGWGESVTDKEGRYEIGSLVTGTWNVMLLDGFDPPLVAPGAPGAPNVELRNGEARESDFTLKPGRRLAGTVVDHVTGDPVPDCTVHCSGGARLGGTVISAQTGEEGEFEFFVPEGRIRVYVSGRRDVRGNSATVTIKRESADPKPVRLKTGPEEEIRLRYFTGPPLERKVSLEAKRSTLDDALKAVCTDAGLTLDLDTNGLKKHGYTKSMAVSVTLKNVKLRDALIRILQPYKELGFTLDGVRIFVSDRAAVNAREAQQKKKRLRRKQTGQVAPVSSRLEGFAKGAGFVTCKVKSLRAPIAGAKVTLKFVAMDVDSMGELFRSPAPALHQTETVTGTDGSYRLEVPGKLADIPDLQLYVDVEHDNYLPRSMGPLPLSDFDMKPINTDQTYWGHRQKARAGILNTVIRKGQHIKGQVLLPDGKPAAGATVATASKPDPYAWKFPDPNRYYASAVVKTDAAGRFTVLADTRATLTISMPGQAPLVLDEYSGQGDSQPSEFRLPHPIRTHGRVTTFDGRPIPGAIISISRNAAYNEFNMPVFFSRSCAADGNGNYQLPAVPKGDYRIRVSSALADVSQRDEYNRETDTAELTTRAFRSKGIPTQPLDEVILEVGRAFDGTDELPVCNLRAVQTHSINVKIDRGQGVKSEDRTVDLTVRGFLGKTRWSGRSVKAGPDGIARLSVPRGIENVVVGTGLARHQRSPDDPIEIGEAIHLGQVDHDISGIVVMQLPLATLKVDVTYSKPVTSIGLSSWHVKDGFKDRGGRKQPVYLVASRQTGSTKYRGMALPDEDIIFQVWRRNAGDFVVLHKQQLRLHAGEERSIKVHVEVP